MRKQARVLGFVAAASVLFAACSGTTATPAPATPAAGQPARVPGPRQPGARELGARVADRREGERPAPAPVGAAGAVRRLLRGQGAGLLRRGEPRRHVRRRRPHGRPAAGRLGARRPRVHDLVGPEGPRGPGVGLRSRRHRPDLPALRHAVGHLEGLRARRHLQARRQEGRRLGLRQRVRGHRGPRLQLRPDAGPRGQRRSGDAVPEGHPGLQHDRVPQQGDRRRRGDDLQRVRAGPGDHEPGDRRAVQARRPQHLQLERLPVVDAPGRDLRPRGVAQGRQQPRRRGPLRPCLAQGLDVLP